MESLNPKEAIHTMNRWGATSTPFFFIISSNPREPVLIEKNPFRSDHLLISWDGREPIADKHIDTDALHSLDLIPPSYEDFLHKFEACQNEIAHGNTYLINLTFPVRVKPSHTLEELFYSSTARYTCLVRDRFLFFSPERFVYINPEFIATYPMKGTLDARVPNGENILRNDPKERAEHHTIVDLLRNDLSLVSPKVWVERFAYIEKVRTHKGAILQMSSEIRAETPSTYPVHLGDIIFRMLPAGSVTGAPKKRTTEIIQQVEGYNRSYYTGVSGYFDGQDLNSCVNIRYIEKVGDTFYFKAGMGLTFQSDPKNEYEELLQKIYLPFS